jgi:hypothetical protein
MATHSFVDVILIGIRKLATFFQNIYRFLKHLRKRKKIKNDRVVTKKN